MGFGAAALDEVVKEGFSEEVLCRLSSDPQKEPGLGRTGEGELQAGDQLKQRP